MADEWIVRDAQRGNERECDSRSEAEERRADMVSLGAHPKQIEIVPPGQEAKADGGTETVEPDVVDHSEEPTAEGAENDSDILTSADELPDKPPVDEDPLVWMPGSFTDTIEGEEVINRQGYEVMAHYYGIGTDSECEVGPEETGFEYARVTATATTKEGVEYGAQGSAHVDRGDEKELLLEMADTRARKRALAQATGTGMLAVEELKNEVQS